MELDCCHLQTAAGLAVPGAGTGVGRACEQDVAGVDSGAVVDIEVVGGDPNNRVDAFAVTGEGPEQGLGLFAIVDVTGIEGPHFGRFVV